MSTDRWQQVEALYHAARARPVADRAAFLTEACADDDLRREVESLLAADEGAESLLKTAGAWSRAPLVGQRLGAYEVLSAIGAGGMGEVYRARDTKLRRDVAIKVLPDLFANDRDRLARFTREAQTLAALNHPNIAQIYGIEESNVPGPGSSVRALVMELVEGDDLSAHIARGPMPVTDALPIARQIADALEAAHELGIVHRDLKPANIKVRADGTVKVLDFGLAKALAPAGASAAAAAVANSPTITSPAMTEMGMILGTAAYMSPEQAVGKAVDKRSDLWAFGVVLLEMLTGRPAFPGETVSHVLAAVLKSEPNWNALPAETPTAVRRLLRRCLERDRRRRIADASDVRLELEEANAPADRDGASTMMLRAAVVPVWRRALPWALAATLSMALIAGAAIWQNPAREQPPAVYSYLDVPTDYVMGGDGFARTQMVFTPDGLSLVMMASRANKTQLFLRSLNRPDARPIAGTDDAHAPFVSPDGKWVGFWRRNEIARVPIEGGSAISVCPLIGPPYGAAWGPDNIIVFGDPSGSIMRVSASGGTPAPVTAQPPPWRRHVAPFFLVDGARILFSDVARRDAGDSRLMVQSIGGNDPRLVIAPAADGRLLPSGQLVFMRVGTLMTVPFNPARAMVTGDPVVALGDVRQSGQTGNASGDNTAAGMFALSSRGDIAFITGGLVGANETRLVWRTPDGRTSSAEPAAGAPTGKFRQKRISPDGSRAIVSVDAPMHVEMWMADWKRDVWTPCRDCNSPLGLGVWSPDGTRLLLSRNDTLVAHVVDGSAADQVLIQERDRELTPANWLADGRIVYLSSPDVTNYEIKLLEPGSHAGRILVPLGIGADPQVSPDGRWLAYDSPPYTSETTEVVVQAFPGPGSRVAISTGFGVNPAWSSDSRTLYYLRQKPRAVMSVDIGVASVFTAGRPRELSPYDDLMPCRTARCYDLSPTGDRFLFGEPKPEFTPPLTRVNLILNWAATVGVK